MSLLDIYDKNGNYIGVEDRKIVHQKGLWHKTVHCWLYDSSGNVFFQRRADRKTLYTTASGHLDSGETVKEAFGREIKEELGVEIDYEKAEFCSIVIWEGMHTKSDGSLFIDKAFANVYVFRYDEKNYNFKFDLEEIIELVKVDAKEVLELFKNNQGYIKGEVITEKNDSVIKNIDIKEFLVNEDETLLSKYQEVLNKIIEVAK